MHLPTLVTNTFVITTVKMPQGKIKICCLTIEEMYCVKFSLFVLSIYYIKLTLTWLKRMARKSKI